MTGFHKVLWAGNVEVGLLYYPFKELIKGVIGEAHHEYRGFLFGVPDLPVLQKRLHYLQPNVRLASARWALDY